MQPKYPNDTYQSDAEAVLAAGAAIADGAVHTVGRTPVAILPTGYQVHDLARLAELDAPHRATGSTTLGDETSFIAQVKRLGTPATVIYLQPAGTLEVPPSLVAVFNDHDGAAPGWRDHRALFRPQLATEWITWAGANGRQMPQADFARFVEANLPDIAVPAAAEMLEVALSIEAKKKVNFASGVRLQNGTHQLTYEETIEGTAGRGQLTIPETITLAIPVLLNGAGYRVGARLRYRIDQSGLRMWIELVRPHAILEHAIAQMRERIAQATGRPILVGQPD